ncbi:Ribonuclease E/G-like protein chloroplastic [Bienertia sinuspersici]
MMEPVLWSDTLEVTMDWDQKARRGAAAADKLNYTGKKQWSIKEVEALVSSYINAGGDVEKETNQSKKDFLEQSEEKKRQKEQEAKMRMLSRLIAKLFLDDVDKELCMKLKQEFKNKFY